MPDSIPATAGSIPSNSPLSGADECSEPRSPQAESQARSSSFRQAAGHQGGLRHPDAEATDFALLRVQTLSLGICNQGLNRRGHQIVIRLLLSDFERLHQGKERVSVAATVGAKRPAVASNPPL